MNVAMVSQPIIRRPIVGKDEAALRNESGKSRNEGGSGADGHARKVNSARRPLCNGLHPNIGTNIVANVDVCDETFIRFVFTSSLEFDRVGKYGGLIVFCGKR